MKLTDKREDAMIGRMCRLDVFFVGIGDGTDPKWLEVKAQREADYIAWLLEDCPGFKGVSVAWPRNLAVFKSATAAGEGKKRLEDAGVTCGDILKGTMMPGLSDIQIKTKWEARK